MKKVTLFFLATLFAFAAFAQTSATPQQQDNKQGMKDLRKDTRDIRHDKRVRKYDVNHGKKMKAMKATKDIKADKKDRRGDVKDLKTDGVKHPQKRADRQIRRQNHKLK
jgi:hypothetical protein